MRKRVSGFTLIELLVVIAIIGLLSAIVLASLNTARNKGKDAAIQEDVSQLQTLMELNYSDSGSYGALQIGWVPQSGACTGFTSGSYAAKAQQICNDIVNNAADPGWGAPGYKFYTGNSVGVQDYSIMVYLNDGKWYCAGSSGAKGEYTSYNVQPGCWNNP